MKGIIDAFLKEIAGEISANAGWQERANNLRASFDAWYASSSKKKPVRRAGSARVSSGRAPARLPVVPLQPLQQPTQQTLPFRLFPPQVPTAGVPSQTLMGGPPPQTPTAGVPSQVPTGGPTIPRLGNMNRAGGGTK